MKRSIPSTLFAALFAILLAAGGCSESLTGPAQDTQPPTVKSETADDGGTNTDDPDGHNTPPEE
jgi:hypothetical protein